MAGVKINTLREETLEQLQQRVKDLRVELASLRVQLIAGGSASRISQIGTVRKDIARVLTVISQKQRADARKKYAKNPRKPLDLRFKKTRAMRRRLTKFEATRQTRKQHRKQSMYPQKVFYLKA